MLAIKKLQSLAKGSNNNKTTSNGFNTGQLNHYSSASSLQSSTNLNSSLNSLNSTHSTASKSSSLLHTNLYLPLQTQPIYGIHTGHQTYQEVPINTNRNSTKLNNSSNVSPDGQCLSNNTSVNSNMSIGGLINQNGNTNGTTPTTPELKTFQQLSTSSATNSTSTISNAQPNSHENHHQAFLTNGNGSISSSSNSLASSLNNSSNSALNLPPLLINNQHQQYAYINGQLVNTSGQSQLVNGQPQIINGQIINGQLVNTGLQLTNHQLNGHHLINNSQLNQLPTQVMMVSRGRSLESLAHHHEPRGSEPIYEVRQPIYDVRQIVNGQTAISVIDGQPVQVIYANANQVQNQMQNQDQKTNTIYLQPQQQNPNEMYLFLNNDMDGTATLNRPKNLIKNRPIAKIAAKTRDLNGMTDGNLIDDNISEQKQAILANQQIYGNFPLNGNHHQNVSLMNNNVITNNMINTNLNNGYASYLDNNAQQQIYENNAYIQQQKLINGNNNLQERNSYIYATLKRNKKMPPPIPKRTNSMRTNGQQLPVTAPTTPSAHQPSLAQLRRGNSLDDAQNLLNHQLNQLALAQKLKQQISQRSSCSNLETMQEEVFASCVKSLTSRFSMNSSSLDDDDYLTAITSSTNSSTLVTNTTSNTFSTTNNNNINTNINTSTNSTSIKDCPVSNDVTNKTTDVTTKEVKKDEPSLSSSTNPPTDSVKSHNNQLTNSLSSKIEKLNIVNNDNDKDENSSSSSLNQSTGSDDFPPPPSPSVLLNTADDNSTNTNNNLEYPKSTITPPLPSPPISNQLQQVKMGSNDSNGSMPNVNNQHNIPTMSHNVNSSNRTPLAAQYTGRQFKYPQPANQIFKFDNEACKQIQHHIECTVSSSSSTESMPFANDNVGTMMRPRPNQMNCCSAQQQLKQFASSSSSSSICSASSSSITSSSTSSSLSSVSSNVNLSNNNNALPTSCSSSSLNNVPIIQNVQQNIQQNLQQNLPNSQQQSIQPQHQPVYQSPLSQTQQYNNLNSAQTINNSTNHTSNTIENVVRTSVNCISNLSNHLNLSKLITSNSAATLRFLSKPPQVPIKPVTKNWPCSPVKQIITSPEHVPNINQINNGNSTNSNNNSKSIESSSINNGIKQQINKPVTNLKEPDQQLTNGVNKLNTIVNSNHDNFRSQQNDSQSSPLNE